MGNIMAYLICKYLIKNSSGHFEIAFALLHEYCVKLSGWLNSCFLHLRKHLGKHLSRQTSQ